MTSLTEVVKKNSVEQLVQIARQVAQREHLVWNIGVQTILKAASKQPKRAPSIKAVSEDQAIQKWLERYTNALRNCISLRISNPPGTIPDPIVETIIYARLPHLSNDSIKKIAYGHRLAMSAENILGLLLEEYLARELLPYKWHCCWGEALLSVDFVNEDGRLLQVKNRSNSENSSSNKVRVGTRIEKWFRVHAAKGHYLWDDLRALNNNPNLTEEKFKEFVIQILKKNPQALPVEAANPWKQ